MNETILAVGAYGKFAEMAVPELVSRGVRVRGLVHTLAAILGHPSRSLRVFFQELAARPHSSVQSR
jgi:hypothetical protein